ncbi:MAG TPA: TetR/AcrR family transcriptional regulator [Caldimonas sp.]|nr:TetR/AcrR family transcriptional regulator [Caldimonas sp.]
MRAAHELVAERGVGALSLREVARLLRISHQAPYKHFPTRDHLLAELMIRCWRDFALELERVRPRGDARADLKALAARYVAYADRHPHEYRLMFGAPWPDPVMHPRLGEEVARAFRALRGLVRRAAPRGARRPADDDLEAMFVWAAIHGAMAVSSADIMAALGVSKQVVRKCRAHAVLRVAMALAAPARGA